MTKANLRPYQLDVFERLQGKRAAGTKRLLLVMVTGAGKTHVAVHLIEDAVQRGLSVLFLAHRHELIVQASRRLFEAGLGDHGIIKTGLPPRLHVPVQVGSVQTIHARAYRSKRIALPDFDLIIIDEAHHARARTYQQIIEAFPKATLVGLTATPCRGDGRGLGNIFDELIEGPSVDQLITEGHLVGTRIFAPASPDLRGVHSRQGDYVVDELAEAIDKPQLVGDIVTHWLRHGENRRTVVFTVKVAHSIHVRDEFRRAGITAEHIDGTTPIEKRTEILRKLDAGKIRIVANCMVLTEGWDQPAVSCIVLARPTRQIGLYQQMVGRVLRPYPASDKTDAVILDHAGAVHMHGFPEDPIQWTLSTDKKAVNKVHEARLASPHTQGLKNCPLCGAVRMEGKPCGACGWAPGPKSRSFEFEDGDLARVERDRSVTTVPLDKLNFYRQLAGVFAEKRRRNPAIKNGWLAWKYKEKTGEWPPSHWGHAEPMTPSPEVRAWVRSRDIAYARAMEARR